MRGLGLQLRFMMVVIIGSVVFATGAGVLAYRVGHERALASGRATLEALLGAVEKTAAIGAFTSDTVLLNEVIGGIARNPLVAGVAVRSARGGELVRQGAEESAGQAGMVVERALISPFDKGELLGTLRVVANTAEMENSARHEATLLAIMMVAQTALVSLLLYAAAARLVSRPIVDMARALRRMQPGTDERLSTPSRHADDEIGTLIAGANTLLGESQAAIEREREMRAAIEAMEARYRRIFDASSAGIFVLDADGRLINGNPTVLKVIGSDAATVADLGGRDFARLAFVRPDRLLAMMEDAVSRHEPVSADLELLRRDAAPRWVHCLISARPGATGDTTAAAEGLLIEGVMYDVTERKQAELAARHRADHDTLTGLKNRGACEITIEHDMAQAVREGSPMSLLFVDLDGFKRVNDELGHKAGDEVLQTCARRLLGATRRSTDLVGRIGGDEFVITLCNTGCDDLAPSLVARAAVDALCEPIVLADGRVARIGASVGIACYPRHGSTRRQLVQAADEAMYAVKRHGKNAYAMAREPARRARPNSGFVDLAPALVH